MEAIIESEDQQTEYPSLVKRFQSNLIDGVVIIIMMVVLSEVFSSFSQLPDWVRICSFIFLFGGYEPIFTALACTLGQKITGVRVRKYEDTQKKINIGQAYLIFVTKFFLGIISFFTIHSNRERRAIHDMVSGSVVIGYKD
jgi:uncharacterized RDD family membrane protein YckC